MVSAWIQHVQKYSKDNGVSYKEAMSSAKSSYVKPTKKVAKSESTESSCGCDEPVKPVKKVKKVVKKK
jgi:hypothetical protein